VGVVGRGLEAPGEKVGSLIYPMWRERLDSDCVSLHPLVLPAEGLDQTTGSGRAVLAVSRLRHLLEQPGVAVRVGDIGEGVVPGAVGIAP